MAAPLLMPRRDYRDRYTAAGDGAIDLASMVPVDMPAAASFSVSWSIGTGSHWSKSGSVLTVSSAGDSADLSDLLYEGTITATWAEYEAPNNTATAAITIIAPAASVYVDEATGSDAAAGTKAAPWKHSPNNTLATNVAAAHTASGMTLCVHKDGSFSRSDFLRRDSNLIDASACGWGDGSKATITGADLLPAATTPSSGEVFANPNIANIDKFTLSAPLKMAQLLIDRQAADGLVQWAQWPSAGADPYKDAFDPFRDVTGGMYQVPITSFGTPSADTPWTVPTGLRAAFDAEFGVNSAAGALFALPGSANFVKWFVIKSHTAGSYVLTFDIGSHYNTVTGKVYELPTIAGTTAVQICGHPRSIKAAGQFAFSSDAFTSSTPRVYAWFTNGSAPEIMMRRTGYDASMISDGSFDAGAIYGFRFDGYYGDTNDSHGSAISIGRTSGSWRFDALDIETQWLSSSGLTAGASYRGMNTATVDGCIIQGVTISQSVRTAVLRMTSSINTNLHIYGCNADRCSATTFYITNSTNTVLVEFNRITNGSGPHANCYSFYDDPALTFRYNYGQGARFLTMEAGTAYFHDNTFVMDEQENAGALYGGGHTFERCVFLRYPNTAGTGKKAFAAGSDAIASTFTNCVFDGLSGGNPSTFTDCIVTSRATGGTLIDNNTGGDTGNTYEPYLWDGNFAPLWKQLLGTGPHASSYIYGIAVFPGLTNLTDQALNETVYTGWLGPVIADSLVTWTVTGALNEGMSIASDATGTGATAYADSGTATDLDGMYVQFRQDTTAAYAHDNTAVIDWGNDNVYYWTARTVRENGWTGADIDRTTPDEWRAPATALGANTQEMILILALKPTVYGATSTFFGHSSGNICFRADMLTTRKVRFSCRNPSNVEIMAGLDTPTLPDPADAAGPKDILVAITVDMSQTTGAAAVKMAVDVGAGLAVVTPTGPSVFNTSGTQDIWWAVANALFRIGGNSIDGVFSMAYCHNEWVDLTDQDVLDRISALAMGEGAADGSNITGTQPIGFWLANETQMNSAAAGAWVNLGTGPDLTKQGSTAVTAATGYAASWPPYDYATAVTIEGSDCTVGVASPYTAMLNGAVGSPRTITLSDGGAGGAFSPTSIDVSPAPDDQVIAFTYTPATEGAIELSGASSGLTPGDLLVTAAPAAATTYTFTGPPTATVGVSAPLTVVLDGTNDAGVSIDFDVSGVTGLFSENPIVVAIGTTSATVDFTPTSAGTATITPDSAGGLIDPDPLVITVSPAAATGGGSAKLRRLLRHR